MKFLTDEGKIADGKPLTEDEVQRRAELVERFHEVVCNHGYHGKFDGLPKCESLANDLIGTYTLTLRPQTPVAVIDEEFSEVEPPPVLDEPITLTPEAQKAYDESSF